MPSPPFLQEFAKAPSVEQLPLADFHVNCLRFRNSPGSVGNQTRSARHVLCAQFALGEGLPMIGKLLGPTQVQTTARYAHLARDSVKASVARIGDSIDDDLDAAPS